jgi:hypothetical protein
MLERQGFVLGAIAPGAVALGALLGARPAHAALPVGYVDAVTCDGAAGWAQDPDEPTKSIDVHFYFGGPAGSGAPAVARNANVYRADLCTAIGSCEHGYGQPFPFALLDGAPRPIHVYAIDSMGGPNPELSGSPGTLACVPTPTGVLRRVDGASGFDAWAFDSYWDLVPVSPPNVAELAASVDWPGAPRLAKGSGETVFVLDEVAWVKRPLTPEALATWHLAGVAVDPVDDATLAEWTDGTPLRPRPMLVLAGGLHVVDDAQPASTRPPSETPEDPPSGFGGFGGAGAGASGGETPGGGAGSSSSGADDDAVDSSGCGVATRSAPGGWVLALAACLGLVRRQRRARPRDASSARGRVHSPDGTTTP